MAIEKESFGRLADGREASLYTITNKSGMSVALTDYGAAVVRVIVPDKDGGSKDVVLGYEDAAGYESGDKFFGAVVGRNANRIAGASFELNEVVYNLADNDNGNNLHSGTDYYNKRMWNARMKMQHTVVFELHSMDGDQGYPGVIDFEVSYTLTEENELKIEYYGVPSEDTIVNMTNHSYFNLDGHDYKTVLEHEVAIDADYFTIADEKSIPTGELVDVTGTPMDFRKKKMLGQDIDADYKPLVYGNGYDHNWALNNGGTFAKVAEATGAHTGITMEVYTDLPGMQLYTSNFVEHEEGKDGVIYQKRCAVCFETQYFPDAVHKEHFKGPVCLAGENYRTTTVYKFITE